MIYNTVRPEKLTAWIKSKSPGSIIGTAGDNWKAYLKANGGTGITFYDLEMSYLRAQGYNGGTWYDMWQLIVAAGTVINNNFWDRLRDYFNTLGTPSVSFYLLEDGTSKYLLENGTDHYILE